MTRQLGIAMLESCLALTDICDGASSLLMAISCANISLNVAHHALEKQVRRITTESGEHAHRLVFHLAIIASFIGLLLVDITLMAAVLLLVTEMPLLPFAIAADSLTLSPLLWLILTDYMSACYQHWSDEGSKSTRKWRSVALTIYQSMRLLNHTTFLVLDVMRGRMRSNMIMQFGIIGYALYSQAFTWHRQRRRLNLLLKGMSLDASSSYAQDEDDASELCLICRETLLPAMMGEQQHQPITAVAPSPNPTATKCRLPCGHAFHSPCLLPWLRCALQCPTCRSPVNE